MKIFYAFVTGLVIALQVQSQVMMNIYENNGTTVQIPITIIDSVNFSPAPIYQSVYENDGTIIRFPLTEIDSINYSGEAETEDVLVGFHIHTFIDSNLVDPVLFSEQWFTDSLGRLLNLEVAQFYITNIAIHLYGTDTWVPISNDVIMKRIDNEIYPLGNIPSAEMDSVKFTVGTGNLLNSQPPSSYSSTSPLDSVLSSNEQALMWGSGMAGTAGMASTSGYTFMNIQGHDSTDHLPLNYQIGGFGDTVNIVLAYDGGFNFSPVLTGVGQLNLIHIIADYGKLLQVIQKFNSNNNNSQFWNPANSGPSDTLLQNIKNMFRWECDPPIDC